MKGLNQLNLDRGLEVHGWMIRPTHLIPNMMNVALCRASLHLDEALDHEGVTPPTFPKTSILGSLASHILEDVSPF